MTDVQIEEYRKPASLPVEQPKVFCSECVYRGENIYGNGLCHNSPLDKVDYVEGAKHYTQCKEINSDGMCKDFLRKPTIFEHVVKFLTFWRWGR